MKPSATRVALAYLTKKAGRYNSRDVEKMSPEDAEEALQSLALQAGRKAEEYIRQYRYSAHEDTKNADLLEKAWDQWDWDTLADFNVITGGEADFAGEVLATYMTDRERDDSLSRYERRASKTASIKVERDLRMKVRDAVQVVENNMTNAIRQRLKDMGHPLVGSDLVWDKKGLHAQVTIDLADDDVTAVPDIEDFLRKELGLSRPKSHISKAGQIQFTWRLDAPTPG